MFSLLFLFTGDVMEQHEDSSYNSEADSDVECDADDPERLLDAWLGELDNLTVVSSVQYVDTHYVVCACVIVEANLVRTQ